MKNLLLLSILSGLLISAVFAQEVKREIYPKQVSIEHNDAVKSFSGDFINTMIPFANKLDLRGILKGINNTAVVSQFGDRNTAVLTQTGNHNIGLINIVGRNNESTLNQDGNYLISYLGILGNSNRLDLMQSGSYNVAAYQLIGNNLDFRFEQDNSGTRFSQSGNSIPLTIQHSGSTIPITITNQ